MATGAATSTPKIIVNGKKLQYKEGQDLRDLLVSLGIDVNMEGVAAAVNSDIVRRSEWKNVILKPHDTVEIIHAVSGG